jgi:hypothetical protein
MAIVVIGGILLSTLFTLFVVPCAYRILPGRVREHPEGDALEPAGPEAGSLKPEGPSPDPARP